MAVNSRKINHFEICVLNQSHYVVVLTIDNDLNSSPPYLGASSSSTVDAEQAVYTVRYLLMPVRPAIRVDSLVFYTQLQQFKLLIIIIITHRYHMKYNYVL